MNKRLLMVEDHDDFRTAVKAYLANENLDLEIYEAESGEEAIEKVRTLKPDIVLMDVQLPNMNGIDATEEIKKIHPACSVIILTIYEAFTFKKAFKGPNVAAYIGKSELSGRLAPEIRNILHIKKDKNSNGKA